MDRILFGSFAVGIAAGIGLAGSYGLGFTERILKMKLGISDLQPRLGFWLALVRWIGLLLVASVSHSQTDPIMHGQMRLDDFFLIGLLGGCVIVAARLILRKQWHTNEPSWFLVLDSGYMLMWSFVTSLVIFLAAVGIDNNTLNYVLPTFLMMLQTNGIVRAFQQTAEQRTLRAKQRLEQVHTEGKQ